MREIRSSGSVEGVMGNRDSYSDFSIDFALMAEGNLPARGWRVNFDPDRTQGRLRRLLLGLLLGPTRRAECSPAGQPHLHFKTLPVRRPLLADDGITGRRASNRLDDLLQSRLVIARLSDGGS